MISPEEFVERLCLIGADRGPRRFPRKQRDRQILIKSILMTLDSTRTYSEEEINATILEWNREIAPAIETDHVTIRRLLVDSRQLERTADGHAYRVGFPPTAVAFDLEVEQVDQKATVAAYREQASRRRAEGRRRH